MEFTESASLDLSHVLKSLGRDGFLAARDLVVTANGSSMAPTIVRGDRVHITQSTANLREGQIALCEDVDGRCLIHRVVAVDPAVVTRGDALRSDDRPIARVIGVVTRVERTWRSRVRRVTLLFKRRSR